MKVNDLAKFSYKASRPKSAHEFASTPKIALKHILVFIKSMKLCTHAKFYRHIKRQVCLYGYLKEAVVVVIVSHQQNENILSCLERTDTWNLDTS